MNKLSLASLLFLASLLLAGPAVAQQMGQGTVKALRVEGNVTLVAPGDMSRGPLSVNEVFRDGHTVITGEGSSALLVFSNGARVRVRPETSLRVTQFAQESYDPAMGSYSQLTRDPSTSLTNLDLNYGKVVSEVKLRPTSVFEVDTPTSSAGIRGSILASLFDPNLARAEATSSHTAVEGDITVTPANGPTQPLPPGTTYSSTVPFVPENIEAAILNLPPGFNVTSETQADGSTEYQIEAPDGETAEIRVAEQQNPDGSTTKQIDYLPAGQEPFRVERTESVETTPEGETIRRSTTRVSQGDKEQTISVTENEGTGEFTRTVEQEGEVVSSTSRQVDEQGNATIVTTDSQGNTVRAPASSFALDPETGAVEFEEPTGQFSEADPDEFTELVAELGDDDGTPGEDQAPAGEVPGDEAPEAGDDEVLDEAGPEVDPSTELEEATQVTEG